MREGLAFAGPQAIVAPNRPDGPSLMFRPAFSPAPSQARSVPRRLLRPLVLAAAFALAGCGVKGPLEPPPGAPQASAPKTPPVVAPPTTTSATNNGFHSATSAADMANTATPHASWERSQQPKASKPDPLAGAVRPDQPFILDGLL